MNHEQIARAAGWIIGQFGETRKWWNPAKDDGSRYCADSPTALRNLIEDHPGIASPFIVIHIGTETIAELRLMRARNAHSEAVLLLAQSAGCQSAIALARAALEKHLSDGELLPETAAMRQRAYDEAMAEIRLYATKTNARDVYESF